MKMVVYSCWIFVSSVPTEAAHLMLAVEGVERVVSYINAPTRA